jgi:precorrin-4 methylase
MTLEEIVAVMVGARDAGHDVARVHTGDPVIFGSTAEQMRRLDELGIAWEIVPGVSSFTAAAAVLGKELTLPELSPRGAPLCRTAKSWRIWRATARPWPCSSASPCWRRWRRR